MRRKTLLLPMLLVVALPVAMGVTYVALGIAGAKGDVLGYTNTLALLGVIVFWVASLWYTFRLIRGACGRLAAVLGVLFVTFVLFNLAVVFGITGDSASEVGGCQVFVNGRWVDEPCPTRAPGAATLPPGTNLESQGHCFLIVLGTGMEMPCPTPMPSPASILDDAVEGRCYRFVAGGKYEEFPCGTATPFPLPE